MGKQIQFDLDRLNAAVEHLEKAYELIRLSNLTFIGINGLDSLITIEDAKDLNRVYRVMRDTNCSIAELKIAINHQTK